MNRSIKNKILKLIIQMRIKKYQKNKVKLEVLNKARK